MLALVLLIILSRVRQVVIAALVCVSLVIGDWGSSQYCWVGLTRKGSLSEPVIMQAEGGKLDPVDRENIQLKLTSISGKISQEARN